MKYKIMCAFKAFLFASGVRDLCSPSSIWSGYFIMTKYVLNRDEVMAGWGDLNKW